jgi:hypothetical protein
VFLVVACRVLIGATFLAAAAGKLRSPGTFAADLSGMAVVPARYVAAVAAATVTAEAAVGPLVLWPRTTRFGAALAMVLLAAFVAVIASVLRRGAAVSCPCFGSSRSRLGPRHLVRNAVLLAAAAVALAGPAPTTPGVAGVALAAGLGLVAATVVIRLDDLVALFGDPRPERQP